jgi:hypothetical protein
MSTEAPDTDIAPPSSPCAEGDGDENNAALDLNTLLRMVAVEPLK